jgi:hypothetical protein
LAGDISIMPTCIPTLIFSAPDRGDEQTLDEIKGEKIARNFCVAKCDAERWYPGMPVLGIDNKGRQVQGILDSLNKTDLADNGMQRYDIDCTTSGFTEVLPPYDSVKVKNRWGTRLADLPVRALAVEEDPLLVAQKEEEQDAVAADPAGRPVIVDSPFVTLNFFGPTVVMINKS